MIQRESLPPLACHIKKCFCRRESWRSHRTWKNSSQPYFLTMSPNLGQNAPTPRCLDWPRGLQTCCWELRYCGLYASHYKSVIHNSHIALFSTFAHAGPALGGWDPPAWTLGPPIYNALHLTQYLCKQKHRFVFANAYESIFCSINTTYKADRRKHLLCCVQRNAKRTFTKRFTLSTQK